MIAFWMMFRNSSDNDSLELKCIRSLNIRQQITPPIPSSAACSAIKSIALKEGGGSVVIGTQGCEIYEIAIDPYAKAIPGAKSVVSLGGGDANTNNSAIVGPPQPSYFAEQIVSGHHAGDVWGLCTHPTMNIFFSAGDDCTVRCWNLDSHKLISYIKIPEKCRAVDILPSDGSEIAIPLNNGKIWILNLSDAFLNPKQKKPVNMGGNIIDPDLKGNMVQVNDGSTTMNSFNSENDFESEFKCLSAPVVLADGPQKWAQVTKYCFVACWL